MIYILFILVPNIPFWTGLNKVRKMSGIGKSIGIDVVTKTGGVQPFVNVSINGLLWGYPGSDVSTFLIRAGALGRI